RPPRPTLFPYTTLFRSAEKGASDLHLSCGEPPMLRVHGDLVRTEHPTLTPESVSELVNAIMSEPQRARFDREHEVDFACELPGKDRKSTRLNSSHVAIS